MLSFRKKIQNGIIHSLASFLFTSIIVLGITSGKMKIYMHLTQPLFIGSKESYSSTQPLSSCNYTSGQQNHICLTEYMKLQESHLKKIGTGVVFVFVL